MPIFEYSCQDCGTRFEKLVRRSDTAGTSCPSCGRNHLRQELSVFAAHADNGAAKSAPMPAGPCGGCPNPGACGFGD
jgi:putative FmdB family regulatory protein